MAHDLCILVLAHFKFWRGVSFLLSFCLFAENNYWYILVAILELDTSFTCLTLVLWLGPLSRLCFLCAGFALFLGLKNWKSHFFESKLHISSHTTTCLPEGPPLSSYMGNKRNMWIPPVVKVIIKYACPVLLLYYSASLKEVCNTSSTSFSCPLVPGTLLWPVTYKLSWWKQKNTSTHICTYTSVRM